MALWLAIEAKEGRPLTDCRGINRGARQIIEAVRTCAQLEDHDSQVWRATRRVSGRGET
jgi:hypothetical protein